MVNAGPIQKQNNIIRLPLQRDIFPLSYSCAAILQPIGSPPISERMITPIFEPSTENIALDKFFIGLGILSKIRCSIISDESTIKGKSVGISVPNDKSIPLVMPWAATDGNLISKNAMKNSTSARCCFILFHILLRATARYR
jgi:hypothetical protein